MTAFDVRGKVWHAAERNSAGRWDVVRYEENLVAGLWLEQCSTEIAWDMDEATARKVARKYSE